MATIKVDIKSVIKQAIKKKHESFLKESQASSSTIVSTINQHVIKKAQEFAKVVENKIIKPKVPKSTGRLREAIHVSVETKGRNPTVLTFKITVQDEAGETLSYAYAQEYGARAHWIYPKNKKALRFIGRKALKNQPAQAKKIHFKKGKANSSVFVKKARIKAISPKRFLRSGMRFILTNFGKYLKQRGIERSVTKEIKHNMSTGIVPTTASRPPISRSSGTSTIKASPIKWDYKAAMKAVMGD